jgi:hypothetical protein
MVTAVDHRKLMHTSGITGNPQDVTTKGSNKRYSRHNKNNNNSSGNKTSSLMPKVFGFRSTANTMKQSQPQRPQVTVNHPSTTVSSLLPIQTATATPNHDDSVKKNRDNNKDVDGTSWVRHFSSNDNLNHTADDTESSHSEIAMQLDDNNDDSRPMITQSLYVHPTATATTTSTTTTSSKEQNQQQQVLLQSTSGCTNTNQAMESIPNTQQDVSQQYSDAITDEAVTQQPSSSTSQPKSTAKPVSEILWESAEPFFIYSSNQGAKWCNMDHLSSIYEETIVCTGLKSRNNNEIQTKDYDDTLAIVGTQDDDDDDDDDEVIDQQQQQQNQSIMDMSKLCGGGSENTIVQKFSWMQLQKEAPQNGRVDVTNKQQQQQQQVKNKENNKNSRRIVVSRTHEDIEVSPGHHVQVRLPPTNPILKSSSSAAAAAAAIVPMTAVQKVNKSQSSFDRTNNERCYVPDEQQQQVQSEQIPLSTSLLSPPSPSLPLQRSCIARNNSNDSCKVASSNKIIDHENSKRMNEPNNHNNMIVPTNDNDEITNCNNTNIISAPVLSFEVKPEEALELERSISELTMRSSYAATDSTLQKIPENRRMAYYAVGKHHKQSGRGGNRRCYFSGKLILGGTPFYAGSVLQGLRTLVVFCLPSSIGLPDKMTLLSIQQQQHQSKSHNLLLSSNRSDSYSTGTATLKGLRLLKSSTNQSGSKQSSPSYISHYTQHSSNLGAHHPMNGNASQVTSGTGSHTHRSNGILSVKSQQNRNHNNNNHNSSGNISITGSKSMMSKISSLDDLSLSVEGDLDPNWNIDRDVLLKVLPPVSNDLLRIMSTLYHDQFETLPVQVRDAKQWKLYIKFCFFSGLPISDGEMHYKVRDDIAEQVYGEEIVLSHDVLEAAAGTSSAELLTLPNRTVMRYLRKHYAQQCSKLNDRVFQRASWERVAPEV